MFGIDGLDRLGAVHTMLGLTALALGTRVLLARKGTPSHRRFGRAYALAMLSLNVSALLIFDRTGHFGPFHVGAVASLLTLTAGIVPARLRRPSSQWTEMHATFMSWSFVGLLAAFAAEIAVRMPAARFGWSVVITSGIIVGLGAVLIHTSVWQALSRRSRDA